MVAEFEQSALAQSFTWLILWTVFVPCGLAVLVAWLGQSASKQLLACFMLWKVFPPGKKANAAGAMLVPINITSPIATIAKLICLIIISYLVLIYDSNLCNKASYRSIKP
ncbi:MAG: hypothetical protein WA323_25005 [Candidatus Nitrosopolaris sp.]